MADVSLPFLFLVKVRIRTRRVGQNGTFHFTVTTDLLDNSQTKKLTVSQFRRLVNTYTVDTCTKFS